MKNTYWQHEGICRKHLKRRVYIKSYDNIFSLLTIFLSFTIYHVHNAVHSFRFFFFSRNVDVLVYILPIKKKKKKINVKREVSIYHHWSYIYNTLHQFIQFRTSSPFARVYLKWKRRSAIFHTFKYIRLRRSGYSFHWFDRSWEEMCRVDRLVSQFGIKQENNLRCNVVTVPCSWLQFSRIVTPCCDASSRRLRPSPLPRSPNRRLRTIRDGWTGRSWVLRCYWVAH